MPEASELGWIIYLCLVDRHFYVIPSKPSASGKKLPLYLHHKELY